jgi:hypothetical protein
LEKVERRALEKAEHRVQRMKVEHRVWCMVVVEPVAVKR